MRREVPVSGLGRGEERIERGLRGGEVEAVGPVGQAGVQSITLEERGGPVLRNLPRRRTARLPGTPARRRDMPSLPARGSNRCLVGRFLPT